MSRPIAAAASIQARSKRDLCGVERFQSGGTEAGFGQQNDLPMSKHGFVDSEISESMNRLYGIDFQESGSHFFLFERW